MEGERGRGRTITGSDIGGVLVPGRGIVLKRMSSDITPVWTSTEVADRQMSVSFDGVVDADWLIMANAVADEWARELTGQTWGQVSFHAGEILIADVDEATYRRSLSHYITDLIEETTRRIRAAERARSEAKQKALLEAEQARREAERQARREAEDKARIQAEVEEARKAAESADERLRQRFRDP